MCLVPYLLYGMSYGRGNGFSLKESISAKALGVSPKYSLITVKGKEKCRQDV